jgi:hypothetical protein
MKSLLTNLLIIIASAAWGQAKLVIDNGGILVLNGGVNLLIDNPDNTAITRLGTGYIASEDVNNLVIWSVGPGNGNTYLIPFGTASSYMPISLSVSGGSADGHFLFSTNPTSSWKNSDDLPPGVTNVLAGTTDNSAKVIDRFWQIRPIGYTTKPSLDNLVFTYAVADLAAPNTITESGLIAQRWNDVNKDWGDYFPPSLVNTAAHTVIVSHIPGNQLFDWWTLVDGSVPLPVTLLHFQAESQGNQVLTSWQTAIESNSSHFEIYRSRDGSIFNLAGTVAAAGNSVTLLNYAFTDNSPYRDISWYRLKSVDLDGRFTWSNIVQVDRGNPATVSLYPNPTNGPMILSVPAAIAGRRPIAFIYDGIGRKLRSFLISSTTQPIDVSALPAGVYHLSFVSDQNTHTILFIKK